MILHVDGTVMPNTVLTPDRLKASVYAPPHFIQENPGSHLAIAHIVQLFIEYVGIPTVDRWTRSARKLWPMKSENTEGQAAHPPSSRLIPDPVPVPSSHFLFYGRPWGNLPPLSTSQPLPHSDFPIQPTTPHVSSLDGYTADTFDSTAETSLDDYTADTIDSTTEMVMELTEQVYTLTVELEESQRMAEERLDKIFELQEQVRGTLPSSSLTSATYSWG
jgi:hypothetical protein